MKEDDMQILCMEWFRVKYPKDKYLAWHTPNEGIRKPQYRRKLRRMGVLPGVVDTIILEPRGHFGGLALEGKVGRNQLTDSQQTFLNMATMRGWQTGVYRTFEEFEDMVESYFR